MSVSGESAPEEGSASRMGLPLGDLSLGGSAFREVWGLSIEEGVCLFGGLLLDGVGQTPPVNRMTDRCL